MAENNDDVVTWEIDKQEFDPDTGEPIGAPVYDEFHNPLPNEENRRVEEEE